MSVSGEMDGDDQPLSVLSVSDRVNYVAAPALLKIRFHDSRNIKGFHSGA